MKGQNCFVLFSFMHGLPFAVNAILNISIITRNACVAPAKPKLKDPSNVDDTILKRKH